MLFSLYDCQQWCGQRQSVAQGSICVTFMVVYIVKCTRAALHTPKQHDTFCFQRHLKSEHFVGNGLLDIWQTDFSCVCVCVCVCGGVSFPFFKMSAESFTPLTFGMKKYTVDWWMEGVRTSSNHDVNLLVVFRHLTGSGRQVWLMTVCQDWMVHIHHHLYASTQTLTEKTQVDYDRMDFIIPKNGSWSWPLSTTKE